MDFSYHVDAIPDGHEKLLYIGSLPGPTPQQIQDLAQQAPGSVWYIVGEPNRRAGYGATEVVQQLHDLYTAIKTADPTAKITSPLILNWDYTCIGCGGFQSGHDWVQEFRTAYLNVYGTEPPVDIWAIDVFPIDWSNLPTVNHQTPIDQITGLRGYLNSIPEQQSKPIWITELGLHWGWDKMLFPGDEDYDPNCNGLGSDVNSRHQTSHAAGSPA